MSAPSNLSSIAFLIADAARAAMLMALVDGRARPAGELAFAAGVTAQTASSHLTKLLDAGLLAVEQEGRHRYYRLAGAHVASALEHVASLAAGQTVRRKPLGAQARRLQFARCCYDHLAGQLGVAVARGLVAGGFIAPGDERRYCVTDEGRAWFAMFDIDVDRVKPGRHGIARCCLDWTEREHHLAGPLGVALLEAWCGQGWLRRARGSRVVEVTPAGWAGLRRTLGIDPGAFDRVPEPDGEAGVAGPLPALSEWGR
jgi:DNA-binding transcriptional ArsR family regulator